MPTRIKPRVEEISLAFNPANKRKFILHKDEKGGSVMPKFAISVLEKDEAAPNEEAFVKFLKDEKLDKNASDVMLATYRLMTFSKDQFPKKFAVKLQKSFPDILAPLLAPIVVQKDEKTLKAEKVAMEKDLRVTLEKEIRAAVEKEMGMEKDVEVKKLSDTIEALQKETAETQRLLVVEKDARRMVELEKEIKSFETPGDITKMAKDLLEVEKVNPDLAKNIMASYKEFGVALKATDSFKEIGSSAAGADDTAFGELQKIAKEKMEKDKDLLMPAALAAAADENPALYKEYNADHLRKQNVH